MRFSPILFAASISVASFSSFSLAAHLQGPPAPPPVPAPVRAVDGARAAAHASSDWRLIEPHLADPATATPAALEIQGDLLRVRRFPEDALDYYGYALKRGGDEATLLNKIGVTHLEMGNAPIARAYFLRVVKLRRNDALAWNNIGAVEFMNRNYVNAMRNYKRAVKLDKRSAVYHSNLGMAYVELKDFPSANSELAAAYRLDPEVFDHTSSAGVTLHVLSTVDRADFCIQMAKVYARIGNEAEMLHSLETAAQTGMDIRPAMAEDHYLAQYLHDPRVASLVVVAKSMRTKQTTRSTVAAALPPASTTVPASGPMR